MLPSFLPGAAESCDSMISEHERRKEEQSVPSPRYVRSSYPGTDRQTGRLFDQTAAVHTRETEANGLKSLATLVSMLSILIVSILQHHHRGPQVHIHSLGLLLLQCIHSVVASD